MGDVAGGVLWECWAWRVCNKSHSISTRVHQLRLDIILANNPFLTVVLGDFNNKSNLWCKSEKTLYEGSQN